jgi:hypothetical protein
MNASDLDNVVREIAADLTERVMIPGVAFTKVWYSDAGMFEWAAVDAADVWLDGAE